ncbi:fibroblast growth factor-binding protein 1 [Thalassophryne amazonica]|uniref:fibroblast growth factor-binding protein 1 n=1 Tax=Thalassophryne amazonica TaxID=390379 RepID=UPI001470E35C|nr:fibroblast growth factor-binding protein 1 [Thalassophryne amazonica]
MALLTNVTVLLVLVCVSQYLILSSCQKVHEQKRRRTNRGQDRGGASLTEARQPTSPQNNKGNLIAKDKAECTWAATGEDLLTLDISCKQADRSFGCQFAGRPSVCPQYASNVRLYWKQVAQALKKRNLCQKSGVVIRPAVCRKAPTEAHFRLSNVQRSTAAPSSGAATACQGDNRKLADEYCSKSWSSLCTFLFTMVQSEDC